MQQPNIQTTRKGDVIAFHSISETRVHQIINLVFGCLKLIGTELHNKGEVLFKIDQEEFILSVSTKEDIINFDLLLDIIWHTDIEKMIKSMVALLDEERHDVKTLVGRKFAHDIANPITAISMNLEFLKDRIYDLIKDDQQIVESLDGSLNSVNSIRDLLDSYRTDTPMNHLSSHCQLNTILTGILKQILYFLPENVVVVWQQSDDITIELRELTFWRGMMNLLVNAIESIGDNDSGIILIHSITEDNFINLQIIDSGAEFNQNLVHKFRKPFFSTKENHLGLGMSITDLIAGNSGGTINIHREQEQTIVNWRIPIHTTS